MHRQRLTSLITQPMRRALVSVLLGLLAASAQAGMGFTTLPGLAGDGPVTLFYPSAQAEQPVQRGPYALSLAEGAPPQEGNRRLVVISHGSGGSPWVRTDLARRLVEAGFMVAAPQHAGDHSLDPSSPGPTSWDRRPAEVMRAIDAVSGTPAFAALLDTSRVGVYGGSAGGHTTLTLAGGSWSPARFRDHCEAHLREDFASCVGMITRLRGNVLDTLKIWAARLVIRLRFDDAAPRQAHDPRIAAAIAAVPFAADFDMATLTQPRMALGLVLAGADVNQVPRFHGDAVRAACQRCELVADLPQAGHGVMLSPFPPKHRLSDISLMLLEDPPGFDREHVVPALHDSITRFFQRHLGVASAS